MESSLRATQNSNAKSFDKGQNSGEHISAHESRALRLQQHTGHRTQGDTNVQSPPSHTNCLKPSYTDHPPSPFHHCCDAHRQLVFAPIFALFSSELIIQELVLLRGHHILCVLSCVMVVHLPWKLATPSMPTLSQTSNWSWTDH